MINKAKIEEAIARAIGANLNGHLFDDVNEQLKAVSKAAFQAFLGELPEVKPYYGADRTKLKEQQDAYTRIGLKLMAMKEQS